MPRILMQFAAALIVLFIVKIVVPGELRAQSDVTKVYKTNCALCHAADGSGSSPTGKALKAHDLGSGEVQSKSDAELTEVIAKGRGKMPAFGAKLKADDIKQMVTYVRTLAKK